MSNMTAIISIIIYMLVITFGTHFIRTLAFNRYEAVTFECSTITTLISLLLMWEYGAKLCTVVLFVFMLVLFIINAYYQWNYYMKLQNKIESAFSGRQKYMEQNGYDDSSNDALQIMASVAIMPSFSRFIEESRFFNNQGGFIGLIKSIMDRKRFQKKKYQMRESFAENVNLMGPCKPKIGNKRDYINEAVPVAIHANDLALDYSDEKKGLVAFDVTGFGALVVVCVELIYVVIKKTWEPVKDVTVGSAVLLLILCTLITLFSHVLRQFAFARYERVSYEFSFVALVATSFYMIHEFVTSGNIKILSFYAFAAAFVVFLGLSIANRCLDKRFHEKINKKYNEIIDKIPKETETDRAKRRFLNNMKYISEWAMGPFSRSGSSSRWSKFTKRMSDFKAINNKKNEVIKKTNELIQEIVHDDGKSAIEVAGNKHTVFKIITATIGIIVYVALFLCIAIGML